MHIKQLIIPCLCAFATPCLAQNGFVITCESPHLVENAKAYVYNQEIPQKAPGFVLAEGTVTHGKLRLEGHTDYPVMAMIAINTDTVAVKDWGVIPRISADFVVDNAEYKAEIQKEGEKKALNLTITSDCPEQQRYMQFEKEMAPFANAYSDALRAKWGGDMEFTEENIAKADERIDKAEARQDSAEMAYMARHTGETLAAYLAVKHLKGVYQYTPEEIDAIERAAGTTSDTARTARLQKALQRARKYALGAPYSDFEVTDSAGATRKFSSLVPAGKPLLVDIWASWCGPCRSAIPQVRALHEKYGDKLDIVSVSVDEKRADWLKALQEEQMPWSQWKAPREQLAVLADKYGVEFIPFVFVVHEGKIAAYGHPKALNEKIARMIDGKAAL